MSNVMSVARLFAIVGLLMMCCNAKEPEEFSTSLNKRSCVHLGDICNIKSDCCGHDNLNNRHCVLCTRNLFGRHCRCGCDVTGSVAVNEQHVIITDRCDGLDKSRNTCRTRVAPPGDQYYRGNKLF